MPVLNIFLYKQYRPILTCPKFINYRPDLYNLQTRQKR